MLLQGGLRTPSSSRLGYNPGFSPPDKDFVSTAGKITPLRDPVSPPAEMVSVVIPVYNETANLRALWTRLEPVVEALGRTYEVIFVDDGSGDGSLHIFRGFSAPNSRVRG